MGTIDYNSISEVVVTFFDVLIVYIVSNKFFTKRKLDNFIGFTLVTMLFILTLFFVMNITGIILKLILATISITLIMLVIFKERILTLFFSIIMMVVLFISVESVLLFALKLDCNIYERLDTDSNYFNLAILSRFIVFLLIVFMLKKKTKKIELETVHVLKFTLLSIFTVVGMLSSIVPLSEGFISNHHITTFVLIFNNIFIYYILSDFIEISNRLRLKSLSEERIKNELILFKELERKNHVQEKILHDYTNIIMCVKGLVHRKEYKELEKYTNGLSSDFIRRGDYVSTGNALIDVLINNKYEKALSKDITLILKLHDLKELKIKNEDMVVILSNLIDNAIEYCVLLKEKEKEIFLNIRQDKVLTIVIRNPIEKEIIVNDNLIKTTKKGGNHGIGLENIKEIVQKYGGNIYIDTEDGYFAYLIEV